MVMPFHATLHRSRRHPRQLTGLILVGLGALASAAAAKAASSTTICYFGSPITPPPSTLPVCGSGDQFTLGDKLLTLYKTPIPGNGLIDFTSSAFPPLGPEDDTWNVQVAFDPVYGPQSVSGVFEYSIVVDPQDPAAAFFKTVAIDSSHNGRSTYVYKDLYATYADLIAKTNPIQQLTSFQGGEQRYDLPINVNRSLYVRDTYIPGLNGDLRVFNNSYTQGDPAVRRVPGPLPLLGVGAALGFSRKLRRRLKRRPG